LWVKGGCRGSVDSNWLVKKWYNQSRIKYKNTV
jgi:hypothetical protein